MKSFYCYFLTERVNYQKYLDHKAVLTIAKKIYNTYIDMLKKGKKTFTVDLDIRPIVKSLKIEGSSKIKLKISIEDAPKHGGIWWPTEEVLEVILHTNPKSERVRHINSLLLHELYHMLQTKSTFGREKKNIQIPFSDVNVGSADYYAQDTREFKPVIISIVKEFGSLLKDTPKITTADLVRELLKPSADIIFSSAIQKMRSTNIKRYNQFVKELYQEFSRIEDLYRMKRSR